MKWIVKVVLFKDLSVIKYSGKKYIIFITWFYRLSQVVYNNNTKYVMFNVCDTF